MSDQGYYALVTEVGKAKLANAAATGQLIKAKFVLFGDGDGASYNPTENQTSLKNEVHRAPVSDIYIHKVNSNWVVVEGFIPVSVGGFFIREVGVEDEDGDLIVVGNRSEVYKPTLSENEGTDLYQRIIFVVSNTAAIEMKVDPSVAIATRDYVKDQVIDKPSISFIFDDGTSDHMGVAQIFEGKGFRAGFAVNAPQYIDVANRLSRIQIRQLFDKGHEILNHGATHKNMSASGLDPVMVRAEVNTSCDVLNAMGIPVFGWVSAYSTVHKDYYRILSERHAYACTVYGPNDGSLTIKSNPMSLSRFNIDDGNINRFKEMVDGAIASRKHIVVYGHKVSDSVNLTQSKLTEMLNYCKQKSDEGLLEVVTTGEQVKMVCGSSNYGMLQPGEVISHGTDLWVASNGAATTVTKGSSESLTVETTSIDSLVWPVKPSQGWLTPGQPVTFSAEILANNVTLSIGIHFYDDQGALISGKSYESGGFTIENAMKRRYSLTLTVPEGAAQIRPFLRLPETVSVAVNKPRLKAGHDASDGGFLAVPEVITPLRGRAKIKIAQQDSGGNDTALLFDSFEDENIKVDANGFLIAKKSIQVSLNLYACWHSDPDNALPNVQGFVLMENVAANASRHAIGHFRIETGVGGYLGNATVANMAAGDKIRYMIRHGVSGVTVPFPGSDPVSVLDVHVTKIF